MGKTITLFGILVLMTASGWAQDVAGRLVAVRGQVEVQTDAWRPAELNQDLPAGSTIRTFDRSRAVILLADETQLKLNANSELQLQSANQSSGLISRVSQAGARTEQSIINLGSGRAYIRSKKTPARVRVNTPAVTAAIRGTEFDILVAPDGETVTTVLEGSVDYTNDLGAIILNSGEEGRARPGEAPTKTVIVNPEDAVQWTLFYSASLSARDVPFEVSSAERAESLLEQGGLSDLRRAHLLHDAGRPEEALALLRPLDSPEAREAEGWVLLELNRLSEAMESLEQAPSDSPRTRVGFSLVHLQANEYEQAFSYVQDPGDSPLLQLQRAFLLLLAGALDEALPLIESVPDDSPFRSLAESLNTAIYLTQDRKDEALASARAAVAANPQSPAAHVGLSRAQQSFFDLEAATESARRAVDLDPNYVDARVQYARLLFGAGRNARAEEVLEPARRQAPQDAGVTSLLGFLRLAQGQTEEAEVQFTDAIRQDPTLADPRLGLGLVRMRRGQNVDATTELLTATTLEPRLSIYQSYLAKAFYELREFEQAFSTLEVAQELDPRDPTPHFYAGIFQEDLNRPGEAVGHLQESIELNENRAVYRSRYLLDRDQASRNVSLATSYNRLGLSEWGNLQALRSEMADPTNSSAHLFLADTFLNLPGRTVVGGSELLMARLLLPVNANSFNSFNDYTTLFELPRMYWTAGGAYGSFDAWGASLVASGGTQRFAYSTVLQFDRTDGFRPQNDQEKSYSGVSFFKYALTPTSDVLLSYANQQINQGDPSTSPLVNDINDPNLSSFIRSQRAEIGYHKQFRPGSDLVVLFSAREVEQVIDDPDIRKRLGITFGLRRDVREPNLSLQASHLLSFSQFKLRYGFDIFEGRSRTRDVLRFFFPGDDELTTQEFDLQRRKVRFKTGFFRGDYAVRPDLILTAGLNWDWASDDNFFDEGENSTSRLNPQGGILYSPLENTTLRFAFFQSLQTHLNERLVPTHLNGFPIGLNEFRLADSTNYNLGWDQRLHPRSFLRTFLFWRDRGIPTLDSAGDPMQFDGTLYGGRVVLNQFLTNELTLVPQYSVRRSEDTFALRHDHEIDLALRYVHPAGIFVTLSENFLRQTGLIGRSSRKVKVFTTDLEVAYEMPRKWGLASFVVTNLFDREYEFLADPLALNRRIPERQARFRLSFNF